MTTTTCEISKMRPFERMRWGDVGPGQGATSEVTMCLEINRYENFRPFPKAEPVPSLDGRGQAIEVRWEGRQRDAPAHRGAPPL